MTDINDGITGQAHNLAIDLCALAGITGPSNSQVSLNKSVFFIDEAFNHLGAHPWPGGSGGTSIPVIGKVASDGTLQPGSTGITSVVRTGTGVYNITFSTPFADTNYKPFLTCDQTQGQAARYTCTSASVVQVSSFNDTAFTVMVLP